MPGRPLHLRHVLLASPRARRKGALSLDPTPTARPTVVVVAAAPTLTGARQGWEPGQFCPAGRGLADQRCLRRGRGEDSSDALDTVRSGVHASRMDTPPWMTFGSK